MSDRRAKSQGDVERIIGPAKARRRTPPRGVPYSFDIERDEDATPPPQPPPDPRTKDGYVSIPAPIRDQFESIHVALHENAQAMERLWPARHDSARLEEVRLKTLLIDDLLRESSATNALVREFILPVVKDIQGEVNLVAEKQQANSARAELFWEQEWPRVMRQLEAIDSRLDRFERQADKLETALGALSKQLADSTSSLARRIDAVENGNLIRDHKIRVLEDWKLSLTVKIATIASVAGGAVVLIKWILDKLI